MRRLPLAARLFPSIPASLLLASVLLAPFMLASSPAMAHPHHDHGADGFAAGLAHPLLGLDHLLAMLAVGLWAALAGGRAVWAAPAAFLGAMLASGLVGFGGAEIAAVEHVILASVIVLGLGIALALRVPLLPALALLAVFGAAHGYAHGLEGTGQPAYVAGFLLATAALHGAGIGLGLVLQGRGVVLTRALGAVVALGGVALALS